YKPTGRALADHVHVFAKSLLIVRLVDRRIGVTLYIVVERYSFFTDQLFEIIPVPLGGSRPILRKIFNDDWNARIIKILFKIDWLNRVNRGNRFKKHNSP